jgi:hypothetical protein
MDIVERSWAYCSSLIHAQPPVGLLVSFRGGKDDLCTFWMVHSTFKVKKYID